VIPDEMSKDPMRNIRSRQLKLMIVMINLDTKQKSLWESENLDEDDKFMEKLAMMRDMFAEFEQTGQVPEVESELDPFEDQPEP